MHGAASTTSNPVSGLLCSTNSAFVPASICCIWVAGPGTTPRFAAELVGVTGKVTAIEIDAGFVQQARSALSRWGHVSVVNVDGSMAALDPVDAIIVSAGATHPLPAWLDA